jgi:L-ascorbate metabolism protein UlaG (beta-lactamase superfamily)
LIGYGGLNILTDPFFGHRASPFGFAGPQRYVPPGIPLDDLPKVDVILISHNHYDSFDDFSLERLAAKFPGALVLAPLGNGDPIRKFGFAEVPDMDWYDKIERGGVTFQMTPGIHWANRWPWDIGETLWGGFTISGAGPKLWFAGDTAIGPAFEREIAPKTGPVDIALVPIGAFLPRAFMEAVHVTPEEAVELARVMGAKAAVANHWGTLPLGSDEPREGRDRFLAAKVPGIRNVVMKIGETIPLDELK